MNSLADNLVIILMTIPYKNCWKSKFKHVFHDIAYFFAGDIGYEYFSNNNVKHKDIEIDMINCWFTLRTINLNTVWLTIFYTL